MTSSDARRWTVYLLRCRDGSLYAGITVDLTRRLEAHAAGRGARYTRARLPVALAWSSGCKTGAEARRLEARIKALPRAQKLRLAEGDRSVWREVRSACGML
ncbi:MAG: GIY-YIG nuclease family protein [Deltaproteobacteria bacterium]|nr:GIY-YIG nuclease family protein [Deltaproteobacteria bacterium]